MEGSARPRGRDTQSRNILAARMIVEIAKTQDDEVGDGTTSAVVIAGELLKNVEDLLVQEMHPTLIVTVYRLAAEKAYEIFSFRKLIE